MPNTTKMKTIKFHKHNIFYTDQGKGKVIVFLHGFTESSKIWKKFSAELSKKFRIICIDLPGHGKSDCIDGVHSMELMAEVVHSLLKKVKVSQCLMVGHSMGGYVTLVFSGKYPKMLKGFVLFHSHCYADSHEDQVNRDRTIGIVNQDKFSFISQFIPGLFPPEVHEKFAKEIKKLVKAGGKMPGDGIIAALEGMKIRKDQTDLLKTTKLPVLFILGLKDAKAPIQQLWDMVSLPAVSRILLLRDCGHMGYMETPEETLGAIMGFAENLL